MTKIATKSMALRTIKNTQIALFRSFCILEDFACPIRSPPGRADGVGVEVTEVVWALEGVERPPFDISVRVFEEAQTSLGSLSVKMIGSGRPSGRQGSKDVGMLLFMLDGPGDWSTVTVDTPEMDRVSMGVEETVTMVVGLPF